MTYYEPSPLEQLVHAAVICGAAALVGAGIAAMLESPKQARRPRPRETANYELRNRGTLVYYGITNNLDRRISEHERAGKVFDEVVKVGAIASRWTARKYEKREIASYQRKFGNRPAYNRCA